MSQAMRDQKRSSSMCKISTGWMENSQAHTKKTFSLLISFLVRFFSIAMQLHQLLIYFSNSYNKKTNSRSIKIEFQFHTQSYSQNTHKCIELSEKNLCKFSERVILYLPCNWMRNEKNLSPQKFVG